MKCFYHPDLDALGVCKGCSRGLCNACAADSGNGLACASTCVEYVREVNELIERSLRVGKMGKRNIYLWPGFSIFMGVTFFLAPLMRGRPLEAFTTVMGLAFIGLGLLVLAINRKAFVNPAAKPNE